MNREPRRIRPKSLAASEKRRMVERRPAEGIEGNAAQGGQTPWSASLKAAQFFIALAAPAHPYKTGAIMVVDSRFARGMMRIVVGVVFRLIRLRFRVVFHALHRSLHHVAQHRAITPLHPFHMCTHLSAEFSNLSWVLCCQHEPSSALYGFICDRSGHGSTWHHSERGALLRLTLSVRVIHQRRMWIRCAV
jgi:hypothetical protein